MKVSYRQKKFILVWYKIDLFLGLGHVSFVAIGSLGVQHIPNYNPPSLGQTH